MKPRRWRKVTMAELRRIWDYQRKRRICFNGCTNWELINRYGDDCVKHVMGHGWYKLTSKH